MTAFTSAARSRAPSAVLRHAAAIIRDLAELCYYAGRPTARWLDAALRDAGGNASVRFDCYAALSATEPGPGSLDEALARLTGRELSRVMDQAAASLEKADSE